MCNKNGSPMRHRKTAKTRVPSKPTRRTRTKTRKPRFLSLKLALSANKKTQTPQENATNVLHKQQLNLFPLHPEHLVHDRDMQDDHVADQVAFLFETSTDDTSTTLQGLLDTTTTTTTTATTSDVGSPLSPSLTYVSKGHDDSEDMCGFRSLLGAAMRRKERDSSTEKWVSYCEVVKKEQEEESSCCGGTCVADALSMDMQFHGDQKGLVGLKLDYQQILNAWSDKGSLYIEGDSPQTVPDLHDTFYGLNAGKGSVGNLWKVPEMDSMRTMEKVGTKEGWNSGQREASVLRYKEKRQSRLYSKRIRYEVRKLNAEKRPRMKLYPASVLHSASVFTIWQGRFVKRSEEE
ncbi:hypothetical protein K2173_014116 [Erythroxylum novogranatense]|uniref:CCT domain-containing protein n=1 Tax=Erythroxylum novogranatense TaxID=1862640 RepID=A0AAV8SDB7_9ROSI|nr:hypothetical protein K2173_014116 [Erythroxylum novogranatense]